MLDLIVRRKRLSLRLRDEMLSWEHSGFSVDGSVKMAVGDYGSLRRLVPYLARPTVSAERVAYERSSGTVIVRSSKKVKGVALMRESRYRLTHNPGDLALSFEETGDKTILFETTGRRLLEQAMQTIDVSGTDSKTPAGSFGAGVVIMGGSTVFIQVPKNQGVGYTTKQARMMLE